MSRESLVTLKLIGFAIEPAARQPIAILKDEGGEITFPLWLENADVVTISIELLRRELAARNGGKELLVALQEALSLKIVEVVIDSRPEGSYGAAIIFAGDDGELTVEVALAEALVASLKYRLPILVSREAVERAAYVEQSVDLGSSAGAPPASLGWLENLDPATFGKYPM